MTESSPASGANGDANVAIPGAGGSTALGNEKFGTVVLNISNSVLPLEKLSPTPSSLEGMTQAVEDDLRNLGCDLIQTAGKLLRLPQVAMATACVLFHRFLLSKIRWRLLLWGAFVSRVKLRKTPVVHVM